MTGPAGSHAAAEAWRRSATTGRGSRRGDACNWPTIGDSGCWTEGVATGESMLGCRRMPIKTEAAPSRRWMA